MSKNLILKIFLVVVCIAPAGVLHAAGNISLGGVQVNPYLNFRGESRSNIYLTAEDEISDFIITLSPGVQLFMPSSAGDFELDYNAKLLYYSDNSREDTRRHMAFIKGDIMLGSNFDLLIQNRYHVTDDPATSELTDREDRTRNAFEMKLTRLGNLLTVGGGFTSTADDYKDRDELDRTENFFTLDGYYKIFPQTDLRARYRFGKISYDSEALDKDSSFNELTAGVSGRLSPKITGEVRAGYQKREYDNPSLDDFSGLVVYTGVVHELNQRVRTSVSLTRGAQESTFADNNYYVFTRLNLDYRHHLGKKNVLKLGLGYENSDYPVEVSGDSRQDVTLSFGIGWDYELREWATVGLSYDYKDRDSDFAPHNYDYTDSRIALHCSMKF